MKLIGFALLVSGAFIALAAFILLPSAVARFAFLLAGVAIQAIGLVMIARAHRPVGSKTL